MLNTEYQELLNELLEATNLADLNSRMQSFLNDNGFYAFIYGFACTPGDIEEHSPGVVFQTTIPQQLMELYYHVGGMTNDPVAERVFELSETEIVDARPVVIPKDSPFYNHPAILEFMEESMDLGVLTPVKQGQGAGSFLAWTKGGSRKARRELVNQAKKNGLVEVMAQAYHQALYTLGFSAEQFSLTRAELEALKFIANGKTANWIAEHLIISNRAVEKRLARVRKKLDASNASNAVFRATILGLI